MTPFPIAFALMSTTKGHFGIKTRWRETIDSFSRVIPLDQFAARLAHIKVSPDDDAIKVDMVKTLGERGFEVAITEGDWVHGNSTHQLGYLADLWTVINRVKTPYMFICEDDWYPVVKEGNMTDHLARAIGWLEQDPTLMQVRIPRWWNEMVRIQGLKVKHGLDRWAEPVDQYHFRHDDYSANPSLYRTRDLRAALVLVHRTNLPKHVEHGVGEALRVLSGFSHNQFACFEPSQVYIRHLGTLPGEEDSVDQPLIAT
jgi:hypothetical protein